MHHQAFTCDPPGRDELLAVAPLQFCYTGRMGLLGNLNTAQIVEQVVQARR